MHRVLRQSGGDILAPLDREQAAGVQIVEKSGGVEVVPALHPVHIKMIQRKAPADVLVHKGKGGGRDLPGIAKPARNPGDQAGFPHPEAAGQGDHSAMGQPLSDGAANLPRLLRAVGEILGQAAASFLRCSLKQAGNISAAVDINPVGGRCLRQTGHGHDVPGQRHHKAGAGREPHLPHGDRKAGRPAEQSRIIRQRILCFGDADRHPFRPEGRDFSQPLLRRGGKVYPVRAIDIFGDTLNLFPQRQLVGIQRVKIRRLFAGAHNRLSQLDAALSPFGENLTEGKGRTPRAAVVGDGRKLGVGIAAEAIKVPSMNHCQLTLTLAIRN